MLSWIFTFLLSQTFRAWRLERKEQRLLKKQEQIGKKYNVIKNVSTHSMLNDPDGIIIKLELKRSFMKHYQENLI